MPSQENLQQLRELQRLRERQQERSLRAAISSRCNADMDHQFAHARLEKAEKELDATVGQPSLPIGRWLLLASHVSQRAHEATNTHNTLQRADLQLANARTDWEMACQRSRELDDQTATQARKERRKVDDRRERTSLSLHCLRQGSKS